MLDASQIAPEQLATLGESELRELATRLLARIEHHNHEIDWRDAKLEKLAYEIAHLRRMKFSARSAESFRKKRVSTRRSRISKRRTRPSAAR